MERQKPVASGASATRQAGPADQAGIQAKPTSISQAEMWRIQAAIIGERRPRTATAAPGFLKDGHLLRA